MIVLRESPDWGRLTHGSTQGMEGVDAALGRPPGFMREAIELWDATFRRSFFEVRQALKDLTLRSFASVRGARVIPASEVDAWPPESIVLFSDDDDWFAPDVVERIARLRRRPHGVTWTSIVHDGGFKVRPGGFCYTNNYAVMSGAPLGGPWSERVLLHGKADTTFHRSGFYARTLSRSLSASNKHPASALRVRDALAALPGPDGLAAEVEAFLHRADAAAAPSGELAWLADPAAATVELFAGLGRR